MKARLFRTGVWFISLVLLISCGKDDDSSNAGNSDTVKNTIASGTWRITYFWDSDKDETSHFAGYNFTFSVSGSVTVTNGSASVNGTWSAGTDDSQPKLMLYFTAPSDFEDLNDDWHIVENTELKIRLEDVSGGNGGTDNLNFEKN